MTIASTRIAKAINTIQKGEVRMRAQVGEGAEVAGCAAGSAGVSSVMKERNPESSEQLICS